MDGLHLTADLHGCRADPALMCRPDALRMLCLAAVDEVGLQPVGELFHRFPSPPMATGAGSPGGITGVVLLAESHLAVHTWPEQLAVTLDVYVCNLGTDNSARAMALMDRLVGAFDAAEVQRQQLRRGLPAALAQPAS
jgi:S-adenosylmethionine decarboxylase